MTNKEILAAESQLKINKYELAFLIFAFLMLATVAGLKDSEKERQLSFQLQDICASNRGVSLVKEHHKSNIKTVLCNDSSAHQVAVIYL